MGKMKNRLRRISFKTYTTINETDRQLRINVTKRRVRETILAMETQLSITYSKRVSAALTIL